MTAYTNDELRQLFQSKFDLGTWTDVLKDLFLADELRTSPEALSDPGDCDQAYYLGALNTGDNYRIGFFYYEIKSSKVARKKVGLRNLVRTFINPTWGMFDAALAVFDDGAHWRLSFICDIKGENTAPRRYTFVFGDATQGCRTAIERFALLQEKGVSFASLMEAFSVEKLSQEFYEAIFEWYQWACSPDLNVTFANNPDTAADDRDHLNEKIIRLITRLLFCWFIKQKGLVPNELFAKEWAKNHLVDFDFNLGVNPEKYNRKVTDFDPDSKTSGNYYAAVLQNLFFATLNTEKNERNWANGNPTSNDNHYGIKTLWRDNKGHSFFKNGNGQVLQALFDKIPYLNGGLFECLDKPKSRTETKVIYYDAFSRDNLRQKRAFVPNVLFFKKDKGLFEILNRFNFTIEESSHDEQQVALDPELLGKVFENLLGEFNPETQENARKNSGSFYTPREIVDYMVKQSLREYLSCAAWNPYLDEILEGNLPKKLDEITKQDVINRIKAVKILDPACGSGAFPMGCLNKIVDVVSLLSGDDSAQSRYQTKLDIIRNCIYGSDIQSIAAQISKLRFFISLICDCEPDFSKPNFGIPTLPNLETKFVCANSLIGLKKTRKGESYEMESEEITKKKNELRQIRHDHFSARNANKKMELRKKDEEARARLAKLLENNFASEDAKQMVAWNPYDQNACSPFFDSEWMFGITDGFDVVIGNPPYFQMPKKAVSKEQYPYSEGKDQGKQNAYKVFVEAGYNQCAPNGIVCLIVQSSLMCDISSMYTRELLLTKTTLKHVVEFPKKAPTKEGQVFKSVLQGTCIALFSKFLPSNNAEFGISSNNDTTTIKKMRFEPIAQNKCLSFYPIGYYFPVVKPGEFALIEKIFNKSQFFKNYIETIAQGDFNLTNDKHHFGTTPTKTKMFRGKHIHRYYMDSEPEEYIIGDFKSEQAKRHSERDYLITQNISGTTDPYRFNCCINIKEVSLYGHSVNKISLKEGNDAKYFMALINSRLMDWYFRKTSSNNHVNGYEIESLPIPLDTSRQQEISSLVSQILTLKAEGVADTRDLEEDIDQIVYKLYGLSDEEIRLVEGR